VSPGVKWEKRCCRVRSWGGKQPSYIPDGISAFYPLRYSTQGLSTLPYSWERPPKRLDASEHAHGQPRGQCGAECTALIEIVCGDDLRREDRLGRLRMRADDERLCHGPQAPPGRAAVASLAFRIRPAASLKQPRKSMAWRLLKSLLRSCGSAAIQKPAS